MNAFAAAARANLAVIRQGLALLVALGPDRYVARVPLCFNSSTGGHFRHILEHYEAFLAGLDRGRIDYEGRARDPQVERDVATALARFGRVAEQLAELAEEEDDRGLDVHSETTEGRALASSAVRELEFLVSHTVHHYALIAVIARAVGVEPPAEFGMAPSTLKHQQALAAASAPCAR